MALVLADRVKETSVTVGTGTFTLDGAVNGYQSFSVAIGGGNTCYYTIAGQVSSDWEVGIGTVGTGTLARTTVLSSSNSGSLVNFIAGTKDVFVTYPAERSIYLDSAGSYPVQNTFNTLNAANAVLTAGTISTTPAASTDIVNKSYVDTIVASGVHFHTPVRVESPTPLTVTYNNGTAGVGATLTNAGTQVALTIDGVALSVNDRVLIYTQTNATQNGVYVVTSIGSGSTNWVMTRSDDTDTYGIDSASALSEGSTFFVSAGDTGAGETYTCNTSGVITFGTTNITFAQISATQIYSAGTGLTLTNTTFSITNTAVTAASYGSASSVPNYTVNAQGQLTSAANTPIAITSAAVSGLAASATTDTTNASNISSGTLPVARLSGSYTGITGVGTIAAGTWQGSAIGPTYGGTGFTGYTTGDIIYASGASTLAKLAAGTNGYVLTLAAGIPSWAANSAVTTFSAGTTGLTPSTATSGAVTLAGTLVVSNGGTGLTSVTANRIPYGNGTGALQTSANLTFDGTTLTNTGNAIISDASANAALRITQTGAGNALLVEDSANPDATPTVIDASGRIVVGHTSALPVFAATTPPLQVQNNLGSSDFASIGIFNWVAGAQGTSLQLSKSRSGTIGTNGVVSSGDIIGKVQFNADDGTQFITAAQIVATVDGTPGTNDMPGRLTFNTTADGASSPTERMRITSTGNVGIGVSSITDRTLGIGKNITGATSAYGVVNSGQIQSDVTTLSQYYRTAASTAAAAFTLTTLDHFSANQGTIGATSAVTTQVGFNAASSLTGATNNYGFYSAIPSGTGRWNFYAAGSADNFMSGNLGVTGTPDVNLHVANGSAKLRLGATASNAYLDISRDSATGFSIYNAAQTSFSAHIFQIVGTERARIATTGTISLGAAPGSESLRVTPVASAVNYVQIQGATTGNFPYFTAQGSDTNVSAGMYSKGTGALFFGTNSGTSQFVVAHTASAVNYLQVTGGATGSSAALSVQGSDANISIQYFGKGTGGHFFYNSAGFAQFVVSPTASAVNYLQVTGSSGAYPSLSAQGSSANVALVYNTKGTESHIFTTNSGTNQLLITHTASAVNYLQVTGGATGNSAKLNAAGSDTNIDIALTPKGTGSTYSPTFAASNGLVMNNATINTSYTLPTGYNAMSAGPVTVASGVVVTVPSGSTWVVV